jgi:hypothetical protein
MITKAVHGGPIPGLQQPLTAHDLVQTRKQYNSPSLIRNAVANICSHNNLPEDDILLRVVEKIIDHLPHLRQLFEKFGVVNLLGVHILHRHFTVPDGFHLVGQTGTSDEDLYLTELMDDKLNPDNVCGRKFVYDPQSGCLYPYELHYGPLPDTSNVDPEFFLQFNEYIVTHELTSMLGLMYIPQELLKHDMDEYIPRHCALLLVRAASPRISNAKVPTSWNFSDPTRIRETDCIPDRFNKHTEPPKNDRLLQETQAGINDTFQQHHPCICEGIVET